MKIGIDISQIVYSGGVSVYTRNLVENLLRIDHKNQYCIFGFSLRRYHLLYGWANKLKNRNLSKKFYHLPASLTEILFNYLRRPKIEFFSGKLNLLHTSDWLEPKSSCLKVTTVHDLAPLIYPQYHDPKIVSVFKMKLKLVKKESALIIAVSQSTKKDLIKLLGIDQERIKVIYEAVNEEFVKAVPDINWFKKLNIDEFIISDAIRNPRKNLNNLIKAFELVKDKTCKLILFSQPDWSAKTIFNLIERSDIKEKIIIIPNISFGQLKILYQKAIAGIFPSFYEGFGLSLLEAMSCGCPVIASNASSFPEIIGKAGILIDPLNQEEIKLALEKISENQNLRKELVIKGKQQVEKFSWFKAAEKTLTVYQQTLGNKI